MSTPDPPSRRARRSALSLLPWGIAAAVGILALVGPPRSTPSSIGGEHPVLREQVFEASPPAELASPPVLSERVEPPRSEAIARGNAAPGLRIELLGDRSSGGSLRFHWAQIAGPKVELEDPTDSASSFIVPDDEGTIVLALTVSNDLGMDTSSLSIPIARRPAPIVEEPAEPSPTSLPVADAGDDQLGMVGHQVTLNGMRSQPRGRIGFRWLQVDGPPVRLRIEDGYTYTFVPDAPGMYRFALVVAAGSTISNADYVSVSISAPNQSSAPTPGQGLEPSPPIAGPASAPESAHAPASAPSPPVASPEPMPLDQMVRAGVASIRGGHEAAEALEIAFGEVAGRVSTLYETYDDLFSELSRRLDAIVPAEPQARDAWLEHLLNPLSVRMVEELRAEGLDLANPAARSAPLSSRQRARISNQLERIASGFASAKQ